MLNFWGGPKVYIFINMFTFTSPMDLMGLGTFIVIDKHVNIAIYTSYNRASVCDPVSKTTPVISFEGMSGQKMELHRVLDLSASSSSSSSSSHFSKIYLEVQDTEKLVICRLITLEFGDI